MGMPAVERAWTLAQLHALPEDGNRYELLDGELIVSPAPGPPHDFVLMRLTRLLWRYLEQEPVGWIFPPTSVVQYHESQLQPDLQVRYPEEFDAWDASRPPLLAVEILSPSNRRTQMERKRQWLLDRGVACVWIIDPRARHVRVARAGVEVDVYETETVTWHPEGAVAPLHLSLRDILSA
jgi:Uma2 family endonuclease